MSLLDESSDSDTDESVELRNTADDLTPSKEKLYKTISKHFADYILYRKEKGYENDALMTLEDVISHDPDRVTDQYIGRFAGYLEDIRRFRNPDTMANYLSGLKTYLEMKLGFSHPLVQSRFFENLKRNVKNSFKLKGIYGRKHAPPLTLNDFKVFCQLLFENNSEEATLNRALLTLQWQIVGRINEAFLNVENIWSFSHDNLEGLKIKVKRSKVSKVTDLLLLPHHSDVYSCCYHALACWALVGRTTTQLFPAVLVGKSRGSAYTNSMLQELSSQATSKHISVTRGLRSHSVRAGSASYLNLMKGVNKDDIKRRGGWNDEADRVNWYITYFDDNDVKLARFLSGWGTSEFGGSSASINWIREDERDRVRKYGRKLLGTTDFEDPVIEKLTLSLLQYYNFISEKYPDHLVLTYMNRGGQPVVQLKKWSAEIYDKFLQTNYLTNTCSAPNPSVSSNIATIMDSQARTEVNNKTVLELLQSLVNSNSALTNKINSLQTTLAATVEEKVQSTIEAVLSANRLVLTEEQADAAKPVEKVIPAMFYPRTSKRVTNLIAAAPQTKSNLPDAKKLEVGALFSMWYDREIFKVSVESLTPEERVRFEHYKEVVAYSKCLLPQGTTIDPSPQDLEGSKQWQKDINALGKEVTRQWKNAHDLLKRHLISDEEAAGQDKKRRKVEYHATISTVRKMIPQLRTNKILHFDFSTTVDTVTPDCMKWEFTKHRIYHR